jgi:hypothetical protein
LTAPNLFVDPIDDLVEVILQCRRAELVRGCL